MGRRLARDTDIVAFLAALPPERRWEAVSLLGPDDREALDAEWREWAHPGQLAPDSGASKHGWATWVIMAGRGFGKTRAGAQWVLERIVEGPPIRIALVGATIEEARGVMVEGHSGLLTVAEPWIDDWSPTHRRLRFRTGAEATLFSGASPAMLRGPEHHYAWCDELAKWAKPQDCWDTLQMGLRLGEWPRAIVTTTPRPGPVLRKIMAEPGTVVTGGPTRANRHLSAAWRQRIEAQYAGTRLGRQELEGELLPDAAGALWTVELLEKCRVHSLSPTGERVGERGLSEASRESPSPSLSSEGERGPSTPAHFARTLIAVDPPSGDGTCGIVAVARAGEGQGAIAHVLADHSVTGRSPEGWASAVASAAAAHGTSEIVAEVNQGGKMVQAVLNAADPGLRVRLVRAQVGKSARAEPVAHLCEAGRVRFHGPMPALEAELLGMIAGGGYEGPGTSPDRADAMVWGIAEVIKPRAGPRIWAT